MRRIVLLAMLLLLLCSPAAFAFFVGASLGDTVWYDQDADGIFDPDEQGIPGVTVTAVKYDSAGNILYQGTQVTDANGYYLFKSLLAGGYHVTTDVTGLVPTFDLDGIDTPNYAFATLDVAQQRRDVDFGYVAAAIGDYVWADADADGVQDAEEFGLAGVTVGLYDVGGNLLKSTVTDGEGWYQFTLLPAGTYSVKVDPGTLPGGWTIQTYDLDGLGTPNSATGALAAGETRLDFDFGYTKLPEVPNIGITKTANVEAINAGGSVTYTYVITNTGGQTLYNVAATDDAGTPTDFSDDFVVGTAPSLAPGAWVTFTATKSLPVATVYYVNGTALSAGWQTTEILPNGDVRFTYAQSLNITDNTYGANSSPDWRKPHRFKDLVNSDMARFQFTNGAGEVVMDFRLDYASASSAFPSGYGTRGLSGDGGMVSGNAAYLLSYDTSLSQNLNQSPAYYGYTVNSPNMPDPNWNLHSVYTMVVSAAAFGPSGFGSAATVQQHNSPSKIGIESVYPQTIDSAVTNTVVVTASAGDGTPVSASATETVWVYSQDLASAASDLWRGLRINVYHDRLAALYYSGRT